MRKILLHIREKNNRKLWASHNQSRQSMTSPETCNVILIQSLSPVGCEGITMFSGLQGYGFMTQISYNDFC